MGADSKIQWTHHTFNPWWGCARVSPGCEHCYAERDAKRWGTEWGVNAERRLFTDSKKWSEPVRWNRAAEKAGERHRVFCASMADVFEDRRDLDNERARAFKLIEDTPHLDWLVLTKRPQNIERLQPTHWHSRWPLNTWAGTTVEDQQRAEERIPHLLRVGARVRFLSCEPLLGPIDLAPWLGSPAMPLVDWVIVGGESGPGARPFATDWAHAIIEQCQAASVPVFVKQLGENPAVITSTGLVSLMRGKDRKGGDPSEWPDYLRVREFPTVRQ